MVAVAFARCRAILLLLVFGLGLAGTAFADVPLATKNESTVAISAKVTAANCPTNMGKNGAAAVANDCTAAFCWLASALLPQDDGGQFFAPAIVTSTLPHVSAGVSPAPDPHPPRSLL